jgi:hypothetical protein
MHYRENFSKYTVRFISFIVLSNSNIKINKIINQKEFMSFEDKINIIPSGMKQFMDV